MPDPVGIPVLGLDPAECAAYELLIDQLSATLADLGPQWTHGSPLETVLARLEDRGLVSFAGGRYRALAPAAAFSALLVRHEDALDQARRQIDALAAAYQSRPAVRETTSVIELVTGPRAVSQRLQQLASGARNRVSYLATPSSLFDGFDTALRQGLTCRAIYDRSAIDHPGALSTVERLIDAGQLARVLPGLPLSLYLIDDNLAALPARRHPVTVESIIVVHPSALLDSLAALFDTLWQRALPLHPPPTNRATPDRLITMLLSGLTDEAIARQLSLSHRTIQRRVATLMADLNAHTRFQAGVQAALRLRRSTTSVA